jgi:rhomboid protease GluP
VVTYALLAMTSVVSLLTLGGDQAQLESWLLLDKFALLLDGEYWRLLTVTLVHGSLIHLVFNMYALWIIGPIVEALYGSGRYLAIYLLCAAAGSAASFATSPNPAVGASGAVFGLFGALLVADRVHRPALTRNARNLTMQIGILIAINLLIGFSVRGIDNAAHIGGLLAGAWLGFFLVPRGARLPTRPRLLQAGGVALLIGIIALAVAASPITWHPRDVLAGAAQPVARAELIGDPIGIPAGAPREAPVVGRGAVAGTLKRQV